MTQAAGSDPFSIGAIQSGLITSPLTVSAAEGASQLEASQRAAILGDPVPIVFCRRDEANNCGGVMIAPPATEARFENDSANTLTTSYHLVLSEGQVGAVQIRDVLQGPCRVGTFTQTYDRRAGNWTPGNYVQARAGYNPPDCSQYCGSGGLYSGMSTLSFTAITPNGVDSWRRQVNIFMRNGLQLTRLVDAVYGSSNNLADLVKWAYLNCYQMPAALIDNARFTAAANFLAVNGFNCDIRIDQSENLGDYLLKLCPYFLLTESKVNGLHGLRPLLPVNTNQTIKTTAIASEFTFTEAHVLPGSFRYSFIPLADRRPFIAQGIWRQQPTDDFGIVRTSEVSYPGEALNGPYETHDLSAFCTRENHCVKVLAYIRSRRRWVTHTAVWTVRAQAYNTTLVQGSICRLTLQRVVSGSGPGVHDYLYQVDKITKTFEGDVTIEATHFPIDAQGRSLVALDVVNTTGNGVLLSSNKTGFSCDVNSSADTGVPAEVYTLGSGNDSPVQVPPSSPAPDGGEQPAPGAANPNDLLDRLPDVPLQQDPATCAIISPPCSNLLWRTVHLTAQGQEIPGTVRTDLSVPDGPVPAGIKIYGECLDDPGFNTSSLVGPGSCNPTAPVVVDPYQYQYVRVKWNVFVAGYTSESDQTYANTSSWYPVTAGSYFYVELPAPIINGWTHSNCNQPWGIASRSTTSTAAFNLGTPFGLRIMRNNGAGTLSSITAGYTMVPSYSPAYVLDPNYPYVPGFNGNGYWIDASFGLRGSCGGYFEFTNDNPNVVDNPAIARTWWGVS